MPWKLNIIVTDEVKKKLEDASSFVLDALMLGGVVQGWYWQEVDKDKCLNCEKRCKGGDKNGNINC